MQGDHKKEISKFVEDLMPNASYEEQRAADINVDRFIATMFKLHDDFVQDGILEKIDEPENNFLSD